METAVKEPPSSVDLGELLTGAEATAHAMRQINPDVVPVYPITPQTPIIETFSTFVANGKATSEIVNVESEHSAMSASIGASAAGGRTITATGSQGLALMIENVYIAASMRQPIILAIGNRALSAPINIHCDHSDSMLARDSGVIQIYAENAQEAYDLMVMAPRLAEHSDVYLPVMVCQDGFTLTHTSEPVHLLDDEAVQAFIGDYEIPFPLLDQERPTTQGPFDMHDYYFEHKRQQVAAMEEVPGAMDRLVEEFEEATGRTLAQVEEYRLDDADRAIVVLGSTAGTAKEVVDALREEGENVGLLKIRMFRPFPEDRIRDALSRVEEVAVLDRAMSFGSSGPLYAEITRALYGSDVGLRNYVYGLGGRDIFPDDIKQVFEELKAARPERDVQYLGVRE